MNYNSCYDEFVLSSKQAKIHFVRFRASFVVIECEFQFDNCVGLG